MRRFNSFIEFKFGLRDARKLKFLRDHIGYQLVSYTLLDGFVFIIFFLRSLSL